MATLEEARDAAPENIATAIEAEPLAEPLPECARSLDQAAGVAVSDLEREQQERDQERALMLEAAIEALERGNH